MNPTSTPQGTPLKSGKKGGEEMAPADPGKDDLQTVIPEFAVDTLARCLLPKIQAYFDSPEGQAAFEAWKRQKDDT